MTIFTRTIAATAAVSAVAAGALVAISDAPARPRAALTTPNAALVAQLAGRTALDASPDPSGRVIYFTTGGARGAGIFRVPASGGAHRPVLVGGPLRGPAGLAVSNDGDRLYVADRAADHVLVVPVDGAKPHVLRGTAGSAPRGLEVQTRAGRELVVYSGRSRDGRPALLRISAGGASSPSVVFAGAPLRAPDGVAVSRTGAIYVTDHGTGGGRVLRIAGGRATRVASHVQLGHPGGIALTLDESKLLISSLNRTRGTAQVLIVDTTTGATSTFDRVIGANHHAGGLHRARAAVRMGWADVSRSGRVYRVDP